MRGSLCWEICWAPAVASEFWALGAIIRVGFPAVPRSLQVWYGPANYHPKASRELFHETVHFWQYLASGYLSRLAEEDWDRLLTFERTGKFTREVPRRAHYLQPHPEHGFSPRDLVEAFARYWDVHVIGPPDLIEQELSAGRHNFSPDFVERFETLKAKGLLRHPEHGGYSSDSFDLAMEGPGGGWAKPYSMLRQRLPPKATGALFPVAVNLALQTDDPVDTFAFLISGAQSIESALPSGEDIAVLWRWCYDFVSPLLGERPKDQRLGSGIRKAAAGSLDSNPIWNWLIKYMLRAAAELGAADTEGMDYHTAVERGIGTLAFALACPGDPKNRGWLVPLLAPPLVQFEDDVEWNPARDAAASVQASPADLETLDSVAEVARGLSERWQRFLDARGY